MYVKIVLSIKTHASVTHFYNLITNIYMKNNLYTRVLCWDTKKSVL